MLVEYTLGQNKNRTRGNLKRTARKNGIKHPFKISMAELKTRIEVYKERNNYFRKNGHRYRKKFLLQRTDAAREDGREEVAAKIMAIIKQEQDQAF